MTPSFVCAVSGVTFILIGIWGAIAGDHVLVFHVNPLHNAVHVLSGLTALACSLSGPLASRRFCLIFGAIYFLVALMGFMGVAPAIHLLHLNSADNWLHVALAGVFLCSGILAAPPEPRELTYPQGEIG